MRTFLFISVLIIWPFVANAQDSTIISHEFGPSYVGLFDTLNIDFKMKEPTSSIEGRLTFDSRKMLLVGMLLPSNSNDLGGVLGYSNPGPFSKDTTIFSLAWAVATLDVTDLRFVFAPISAGDHMAALSFLEFDEREPANDGIMYYPMESEVLPLAEFPGFVDEDNYIEKQQACDYIRNWYWPNALRGDASGNGDVSSFDASIILQLQALLIDDLPDPSYEIELPVFCD